jgi:hypothetical protein
VDKVFEERVMVRVFGIEAIPLRQPRHAMITIYHSDPALLVVSKSFIDAEAIEETH